MTTDCVVIGQPTTGSLSPSGLRTGGLITEVELSAIEWKPLPAVSLPGRNAIAIQNISAVEIKIQYDNTVVGYVGVVVASGGERQYDITDSIVIYARAFAGAPIIVVEEIA